MRCLAAIAAFALVVSVPVWAQRGGGGHGGGFGGGHAGFGGGHVGGFSGHVGLGGAHFNHSPGGMHGPGVSGGFNRIHSARTGFSSRFSSRGPFMHEGFRGDRFRGDRFRHDRFRHFRFRNCFGFGCWGGYPWAYGYYDPWWWWDSGSNYDNYDEDYDRDRLYAEQLNWQDLEEQRMLRQEEEAAERDREASTRTAPAPAPREEKESAAVLPATVLVFRDQHKREVDNYAIVGQTLWAFAAQRTEKIPLADLDLAATTKANDDRGLTFRVPTANEAQ